MSSNLQIQFLKFFRFRRNKKKVYEKGTSGTFNGTIYNIKCFRSIFHLVWVKMAQMWDTYSMHLDVSKSNYPFNVETPCGIEDT